MNRSRPRKLFLFFSDLGSYLLMLFTSTGYSFFVKLKHRNPIVVFCEKLVKKNEIDKGVLFLTLVCKFIPPTQIYAKYKLYKIALWHARSGHIKKGESYLQSMPTEKIKRESLLCYWNSFCCFDKDTLQSINNLLEYGVSVAFARYGLKSLWLTSDNNDLLSKQNFKYLNIASYPKDKIFIQEALGALKVLGRDDLIYSYLKANPQCSSYCVDVLALADGSLADVFDSEISCSNFNSMVKKGKINIYSKLRNTNIRIAIVGNSPCEKGRGNGIEIDGHDIVIRFNKYSVSNCFISDYGSKCSIIAVTKSISNRMLNDYSQSSELLITGEDPLIYPPDFGYNTDLLGLFKNVAFIENSVFRLLTSELFAAPSSGLQVLKLIHSLRKGFENVNIYGFGLSDQVGEKPTSSGYHKKTKPSFRHNWLGEVHYLNMLINNTKVDVDTYQSLRYRNCIGTLDQFKPIRIKIFGNHLKHHCGTFAVNEYLTNHISGQGVLVDDDSYDLLVVNGEGDMHHNSKAYLEKMEVLTNALKLGRRAMLVNTVWENGPHTYDSILQKLDLVSTREELSRKKLFLHGINASRYLDLSYWAPIGWAKGFNYKNNIVVTDFYSLDLKENVALTTSFESDIYYVNMELISWTTLVNSLKTASMLITTRHHAVYAACKAETPFITFKGNTLEIEGLIESSGVPIRLCDDRAKIPQMIEWVNNNRHLYEELFSWMRKQPKFTIPFEFL